MANIKNFGLVGIGPQVQFGKGGTQITSTAGLFAAKTSDGSAFVRFQVASPTTNDDATTKNYVDVAINAVNTLITNLGSELDTTQAGAGLATDGTYSANSVAHYLASATSLADADNKLDAALFTANGLITSIETGAGLATDGTYSANGAATYINGATSLKDADTKLDAAILAAVGSVNAEAARAEAAEATLSSNLTAEVARATASEGTLTTALAAEVSRATASETTLTNNLASEVARATTAEGSLTTSVATEVTRATAAEATLSTAISDETSRAEAAESSLSGNVGAEATRAMAAESTLTANLATEVSRATAAETSLSTSLGAETTRATAAETSLSTSLGAETTRATAAEASLSTALSTETTRATGAEGTISSNLAAEISRATAAESTLTSNLSTETARAEAAEATLTTSVANELARAELAEGTLTAALAAEVARAGLAETSLDTRLVTVEDNYIKKDGSVAFTGNINAGSNEIINLNNPVNPGDAANKSYVDSLITGLGNAFSYVGTVDGGADTASAFDLNTEASHAAGDYYKVTTAGYFKDGTNTFFAQAMDGVVKNTTTDGWDVIAHVDTVVAGTTNFIAVTGTVDTGFVIDVDAAFIGRVSALETESATLTADIAAEISRAEAAEATLTTNLATTNTDLADETARAEAAETTLTNSLTAEISRATAAESTLSSSLTTETARAMAAEATLQTNIGSETTRATTAEASLSTALSAETARAEAAEASASTNVAAEAARAMAAEGTLTANLATEVSRATAAEATLTTAVSDETTRAMAAEASASTNLASEVTRATAAEGTLTTALAAEVSRATAAEGTLTSALAAEVARATASEGTLTTDLSDEITRAEAAEATLTLAVSTETGRATAAESTLAANLASEVARATAAEATLTTNLSNVDTAVGLSATGNFVPFTTTNYMNSSTTVVGALTALDTETKTLAPDLANLSQDTIKDMTAGLYQVHTAATATQFYGNVGGVSTLIGTVVASNSGTTTNSAFALDMSAANEVRLEATSGTATDVDLRLVPQGAGHVYIGETGSGIIQSDDGFDLTVAGGDNASGSAGNLILRGGNGTATGIVKIADGLGNSVATFTGTASATSYIAVTNGTTTATVKAAGTGNVDLVLAPNGSGNISASSVRVMNVAAPVAGSDAANKTYVDTQVAAVTTAASNGAVLSRLGTLSETTGTVNLGAVVTGTVVRVRVLITAAFSSGASISVGKTGDANDLMDSVQIDEATPGAYIADIATTYTTTQLVASVTAGSGSTGAAQVFVEYINTAS